MTHFELNDFRNKLDCDRDSQCRSVLAGKGQCGNYRKGAAEYFKYSTKIGWRNVRHLKRLAAASLPGKAIGTSNFDQSEVLIECTLIFHLGPPPLSCINNRCEESYQ